MVGSPTRDVRTFSARIPVDLHDALVAAASLSGRSRNTVLVDALRFYLATQGVEDVDLFIRQARAKLKKH